MGQEHLRQYKEVSAVLADCEFGGRLVDPDRGFGSEAGDNEPDPDAVDKLDHGQSGLFGSGHGVAHSRTAQSTSSLQKRVHDQPQHAQTHRGIGHLPNGRLAHHHLRRRKVPARSQRLSR